MARGFALRRLSALILLSCLVTAAASRLAIPAPLVAASSAAQGDVVLVPVGATWRYLDDGSDQGTAWQSVAFDDSGWAAGPAQLGYGDGDEATVVSYGPDSGDKYVTTYFRRSFNVADAAAYTGLILNVLRDDGAVVYLNGQEIFRTNLPAGPVGYTTFASVAVGGADESQFLTVVVSAAGLVDGANVLAVEVHQANPTSSDISFDLSLAGADTPAACESPEVRFAVIGDFGIAGQPELDVSNRVKSWNPDFVITVGDDNYPAGAADTIDANIGQYYHEFIGNYTGEYGAGAASNNFYPALGNHDWETSAGSPAVPQPYLDYFTLPGNERYYNYTRGPVAFFVVDSDSREPDGIAADSTQAAWLQGALASADAPWRLVYLHHPPYSSGLHGSTPTLQWPYPAWGASAVLAGHDHSYERLLVDGLPYFVNGLGGASRYPFASPVAGSQVRYYDDYGAMLVEAAAACLNFRFITRTGAEIDNYTLTKQLIYVPLVVRP